MTVQPIGRGTHSVGFDQRQVTIISLVPSRGLAICREVSTGHDVEIPVLPMRVRLPRVGESWLVDKTYGSWSFAALLGSRDLFLEAQVPPYVSTDPPPGGPGAWPIGLPWAEVVVKYWNGTEWSTEAP